MYHYPVTSYIRQKEREQLRERLKRGAIERAERDLKLAQEWSNDTIDQLLKVQEKRNRTLKKNK